MDHRLKMLVKTRAFKSTAFSIFVVAILYGGLGIIINVGADKTSFADLLALTNNVLKFCAWFMFGYGTMQAFGRKIEYENINRALEEADHKAKHLKLHASSEDEKCQINSEQESTYDHQLKALEKIENDETVIFNLYIVGIFLFFITSVIDLVLPALQN